METVDLAAICTMTSPYHTDISQQRTDYSRDHFLLFGELVVGQFGSSYVPACTFQNGFYGSRTQLNDVLY